VGGARTDCLAPRRSDLKADAALFKPTILAITLPRSLSSVPVTEIVRNLEEWTREALIDPRVPPDAGVAVRPSPL
jgi:hypothetical protein